MLSKFFQKSEPISFVFLLLLVGVVVFSNAYLIKQDVFTWIGFFKNLGIYGFYVFLMFLYDFVSQKYRLSPSSYFGSFLFLILISLFSEVFYLNRIIFSSLIIIWTTIRVFDLRKNENLESKLFDSGFFLGISFLMYPLSILYLFFIYLGYFIYLKIIDKRFFIPIIGFFVPVFLTYTYLLFFDKLPLFNNLIEFNISSNERWYEDLNFSIPLFILMFVLLITVIKLAFINVFSGIEEELNYKLVIAHLFISLIILSLNRNEIKFTVIYLFFPSIILVGNTLFEIKKTWIKELFFYLLWMVFFYSFFL